LSELFLHPILMKGKEGSPISNPFPFLSLFPPAREGWEGLVAYLSFPSPVEVSRANSSKICEFLPCNLFPFPPFLSFTIISCCCDTSPSFPPFFPLPSRCLKSGHAITALSPFPLPKQLTHKSRYGLFTPSFPFPFPPSW